METTSRISRPLGVWVLTIYAGLFVGIIPILVIIFFGASSELGLGLFISIPFYIAVMVLAFKTWRGGDRKALNYFLVLVTLNYVLVGINNLIYLISNDIPAEDATRLMGRIIRGVLYPAVYIWYFRKESTLEFFQIGSSNPSGSQPRLDLSDIRVVGVYKIEPTLETIKEAAKYHKADWLFDNDGNLVDELHESNFDNLTLIELIINGRFSGSDMLLKIQQNDQAPYMEFYLETYGTAIISEEKAKEGLERRLCFFLHFTDTNKPLEIGETKFNLPLPKPLPERLKPFAHYLPVD